MQSHLEAPVNRAGDERFAVAVFGGRLSEVSGKRLNVKYAPGPVGVHARNFSKARFKSLGWEAKVSLREWIGQTYSWIGAGVKALRVVS